MKFLKVLFIIWSFTANANLPPTTIKGQNGTSSGFFNLQVPANSVTKLNSTTALIETGNDNLLENGSFEHPQATAIWSITGTPTIDTSNQVHGKQAISISISATTVATNTSTINAANLNGLQGIVKAYVKTSLSDAYVCSYVDSAEQSCVLVVSNNAWKLVEIPTILGGTSNGIKVKTGSSTSGTILIDGAFVGLGTPFQNVTGAKLIGALKYAGTAGCVWSYSTATWGNISADTDCATPTVTGVLTAPGTKIPAFVLPAGSPAGTYSIVMNTMVYKATSNGFAMFRFSDGTNSSNGSGIYVNSQGSPNIVGNITYTSSLSAATTIQLQSKVSSGGIEVYGTDTTDGLSFEVYYYPPENKIYSQPNQDYDWTSYTPTFTGFGTVSSPECFHKRKGSDLFIQCRFNSGSTTAVEPRISLPSGLTISSTYVPSITSKGVYFRNSAGAAAGSKGSAILAEPSVGYVTFSTADVFSGTNANWKNKVSSASAVFASGDEFSVQVGPLPISGWTDYGVIVGSFKDYVSSPGAGKLITVGADFYTTAAGTVCSSSPCTLGNHYGETGWITSITRSATGDYSITLTPSYWLDVTKVRCSLKNASVGWQTFGIPNGSGVFSMTSRNNTGSYAAVDVAGTLECIGKKP